MITIDHVMKARIFDRDHWRCQHPGCSQSSTAVAMRIPADFNLYAAIRKYWREMGGDHLSQDQIKRHILEDEVNLVASCEKHQVNFDVSGSEEDIKYILRQVWRKISDLERLYYAKRKRDQKTAGESEPDASFGTRSGGIVA